MSPTTRSSVLPGTIVQSWPDSILPAMDLPRGRNWTVSPRFSLSMNPGPTHKRTHTAAGIFRILAKTLVTVRSFDRQRFNGPKSDGRRNPEPATLTFYVSRPLSAQPPNHQLP